MTSDPVASNAPHSTQVLLLGTYHFANPGLDMVKMSVHDHLSATKQAEIAEVVDSLARFAPNQVLVEQPASGQARLNEVYRRSREGERQLGPSEAEQIGFRLAQRFQHGTVYGIDEPGDILMREFMQEAQQRAPEVLASVQATIARETERMNDLLGSGTVRTALRAINTPEAIRDGHSEYVKLVPFGAGESFAGANVLSAWYTRNIRIYANLTRHLVPGDRVVVVYGAAHLGTLRELLLATPGVEVVDTLGYL